MPKLRGIIFLKLLPFIPEGNLKILLYKQLTHNLAVQANRQEVKRLIHKFQAKQWLITAIVLLSNGLLLKMLDKRLKSCIIKDRINE